MKVIVLATDSDSTWMLVNAIRAECPSLQLACETPVSRWLLLKRRIRRAGIAVVLGQFLFMLLLPVLRRTRRTAVRQMIEQAGLSTRRDAVAIRRFESVNSPECIAWLALEQPAVVILNGTRIVSREVLQCCQAVFLNTHCGITPAYRGVHGAYWALYRNDPLNAGVTIHVVDEGIDTGGIISQARIEVEPGDNFATYPVKQYVAAIPLMRAALAALRRGELVTTSRPDLSSAVWQHPTLWQYLRGRWQRGVR